MGIDNSTLTLLAHARATGVSFVRAIQIGRQRLYLNHRLLSRKMRGLSDLLPQQARTLISDSTGTGDGYSEDVFRVMGATIVDSVDYSDYEKASIIHDMNTLISSQYHQQYTLVFDGGCLEHIFNFPVAIKNCLEMVEVGGHFVSMTGTNNYCGHGFYQFSPELFYRILSPANGFRVKEMVVAETLPNGERYFLLPDPALLQRRIDLVSSHPLSLWVVGERISNSPIFASVPQQSDYSLVWTTPGQVHPDHYAARKSTSLKPSLRTRLRESLPRPLVSIGRRLRSVLFDHLTHNKDLVAFDPFAVTQSGI